MDSNHLDIQTVESLIRQWTDMKVEPHLERETPDSRITGIVVSPGFKNLDAVDRHHRLWEMLREHFQEGATQFGLIFSLTPEEYDEYQSNVA